MVKEEEQGSFAPEPKEEEKQSKLTESKNPDNPNYPLFQKLDRIADSIEKDTKATIELKEAINALLTTVVRKNETEPVSVPKPVIAPPRVESPPPIPTPQPPKAVTGDKQSQIMELFPDDLASMLNFLDKGEYIMIKPRQFLGSDSFAKIASVVRASGGEYVSAGKESHFRIKK
jgi:hypothetical protein